METTKFRRILSAESAAAIFSLFSALEADYALGEGAMKALNANKGRVGIYAGSFDPPTIGHLWMIEHAATLFDVLIVALGVNPKKRSTFSVVERLEMLRYSTSRFENVQVEQFTDQYLIHYARKQKASFMVRGIRSETDYEYERVMRNINGDLDPAITTIFLMPPRDIAEVSSSMVKGMIGPQGWEEMIRPYLSPRIHRQLLQKIPCPHRQNAGGLNFGAR